jgi:hypothetical protein
VRLFLLFCRNLLVLQADRWEVLVEIGLLVVPLEMGTNPDSMTGKASEVIMAVEKLSRPSETFTDS